METKTENNIVLETYNDLKDYMKKHGYSTLALLEQPNHTSSNQELYGVDSTDVNYTLNIVNI